MKKFLISLFALALTMEVMAQPQYDGALSRFRMKSEEAVREGLVGEYYDGNNFQKLVAVRQDKQIYFDWNYQAPIRELQADYFSIRWRGKFYADKPGKYILTAMTDDGMRIWLNGKIVLNAWVDQPPMVYEKRLVLEGDEFYDIRVDYYQKQYQTTAAVFLNHIDDEQAPLSDLNTVFGRNLKPSQARFDFWEEAPLLDRFYTWLGLQDEEEIEINDQSFRPVVNKRQTMQPPDEVEVSHLVSKNEYKNEGPTEAETKTQKIVIEEPNPYEELRVGDTLIVENIYFDQGRARLRNESFEELEKLYMALENHPDWQIKIDGHTDNVGYNALNIELSYDRARSVYNYLINKGIERDRLKFEGCGSTRPIAMNDTEVNKQKNRRVEVTLLEAGMLTKF